MRKGKCLASNVEASAHTASSIKPTTETNFDDNNGSRRGAVDHDKSSPHNVISSQNTLPGREVGPSSTLPLSDDGSNTTDNVPLYKRRGMSETPEIQRKSRKLFPKYRNTDPDTQKRSLTAPSHSTSTVSSPACSPPSSTGGVSISMSNRRSSSTGSQPDGSGSSRKSSVSSGAKKSGAGKQFAVTLLVNEAEKNKIVDMLHRAKKVIGKKVEKVIGKKPKSNPTERESKSQSLSISNAEALTTVLQNWVEVEEKKERKDDTEMERLIEEQKLQALKMRQRGIEPPITIVTPPSDTPKDASRQYHFRSPNVPPLTVGGCSSFGSFPSPVPEESEDEDNEADDELEHDDDLKVQEIKQGEENVLHLPTSGRFRLSRSITPQSPTRSLTPSDRVPRHFTRPDSEIYPTGLKRPSSHYDVNAQAASSRPVGSINVPNLSPSPVTVPTLNKINQESPLAAGGTDLDIVTNKDIGTEMTPNDSQKSSKRQDRTSRKISSFEKFMNEEMRDTLDDTKTDKKEPKEEIRFDFDRDIPVTSWQRPESMTIPIGGVWHPGDDEDEDEFMKNLTSLPSFSSSQAYPSYSTKSPSPKDESMKNRNIFRVHFLGFCLHLFTPDFYR